MQELKANTAVDVLIGPFMDEDDGKTTEEALTIEDEHVKLSKLGQGLAAKNDANNAAHDADGYYNCPLNTTDTASEGTLTLTCHMTGALPVRHEYMVLAEAAWDSKYAAKDTGYMDVNVKAISEDTAASDKLEAALDAAAAATIAIDMTHIHGSALSETSAGNLADNFGTFWDDGDSQASTAKYSDVASILTDTNDLQSNQGNWLTATGFSLASVVGALDDAAAADDPTNADTLMGYMKQLINILVGTAGVATYPAEAAPGNAVSLAEVLRAIHVDVTGLNGDAMRGTNGANTTVPDAAGTAAALHTTTDGKIDTVDGNVDTLVTEVGKVPKSDSTVSWNATALAAIEGEVDDAIQTAKLDHLVQTAAAEDEVADNSIIARLAATEGDWSEYNDESHSLEALRVQGDAAWITATSTTVSDKTGFELSATGLDSVVMADLAAVPGATAKMTEAINWIFELARNKTVTNGTNNEIELYNNSGTKVFEADISDDGTDFTREKWDVDD